MILAVATSDNSQAPTLDALVSTYPFHSNSSISQRDFTFYITSYYINFKFIYLSPVLKLGYVSESPGELFKHANAQRAP